MKIGISSYSVRDATISGEMTLPGVIQWIAEQGGKHIEIVPFQNCGFTFSGPDDKLIAECKKTAAGCGVEISGYTIGANFATIGPDLRDITTEERAAEVKRVKAQVDIAAAFGVKFMRHDAGSRQLEKCGIEQFDRDLPFVADACREVADHAKQYGITTSVENHGMLFQHSERVRRLVAAVGRDNYRTTLDVGNFNNVDEDSVIATLNVMPITSFIHFKDFYIRKQVPVPEVWHKTMHGRFLRGAITGCGDVDLFSIAEIIKKSGFNGFISIEYEAAENYKYGIPIAIKNVKALFA